MTSESRAELIGLLTELSESAPDLRMGQLVANLATLALGPQVESIWDAEDVDLIRAARRLLSHYQPHESSVAT